MQNDQKSKAYAVVFRFVKENLWLFGLGLLCSMLNTAFNSLTPQIIRMTVDSIIGSEELPGWFTALGLQRLLQGDTARVLLLAAEQQGVPVFSYTPLQVKSAVVGYGKAEKEQVMEMTRRLLHLKAVPQPDDAADALAIAICHGHNGSSRLPTAALAEIRGGNRRGRPITYKEKKP